MTPDERFAKLLRSERLAARLTQDHVVEGMNSLGHSNFHQATIFKIEAGHRKVTVGEAFSLSRVIGVPLQQLLPEPPDEAPYSAREARDLIERAEAGIETNRRLLERAIELVESQAD